LKLQIARLLGQTKDKGSSHLTLCEMTQEEWIHRDNFK